MEVKGIIYSEPESHKVIALADKDFSNCTETRRSLGCCLLTIGGFLVDWFMSKHLHYQIAQWKQNSKSLRHMLTVVSFANFIG